jgi:UDP-galactose transporter B1
MTDPAVSVPFPSTQTSHHPTTEHNGDKFPSPLFLNYAQSLASCASAFLYLIFGAWKDGSLQSRGILEVLGLRRLIDSVKAVRGSWGYPIPGTSRPGPVGLDTKAEDQTSPGQSTTRDTQTSSPRVTTLHKTLPLLLLQVSVFQTLAGPIGFLALRHISYPTMVLGKVSHFVKITDRSTPGR